MDCIVVSLQSIGNGHHYPILFLSVLNSPILLWNPETASVMVNEEATLIWTPFNLVVGVMECLITKEAAFIHCLSTDSTLSMPPIQKSLCGCHMLPKLAQESTEPVAMDVSVTRDPKLSEGAFEA